MQKGDAPSENRTHVSSATTRYPNHWMMKAESIQSQKEYNQLLQKSASCSLRLYFAASRECGNSDGKESSIIQKNVFIPYSCALQWCLCVGVPSAPDSCTHRRSGIRHNGQAAMQVDTTLVQDPHFVQFTAPIIICCLNILEKAKVDRLCR